MKCVCGYECDGPYLNEDNSLNKNAFQSIGYACMVSEVSNIDYYKLIVRETTELFACPKCGTVRIKE